MLIPGGWMRILPARIGCSWADRQALQWQGSQALDAILNYPLYNALVSAFAIPGPQNMSALTDMVTQIKAKSTVSFASATVGRCYLPQWLPT